MFTVGTQTTEVVDLADDSEAISLMLGFIYPSLPPTITTFELLEKSLQIAQKYHVESMVQKIDRLLSREASYKELFEEGPLRLFRLSTTYQLRETQTAVTKLVRTFPDALRNPEDFIELAEHHPGSAHIIRLLGVRVARENILRSLLLDLTSPSIFSYMGDEYAAALNCKACQDKSDRSRGSMVSHSTPGWFHLWGSLVYESLTNSTWDASSSLFTLGALQKLHAPRMQGPVCWDCVDILHSVEGGRVFDKWAKEAQTYLKGELGQLDDLDSL